MTMRRLMLGVWRVARSPINARRSSGRLKQGTTAVILTGRDCGAIERVCTRQAVAAREDCASAGCWVGVPGVFNGNKSSTRGRMTLYWIDLTASQRAGQRSRVGWLIRETGRGWGTGGGWGAMPAMPDVACSRTMVRPGGSWV